jgi:hypothetical protein
MMEVLNKFLFVAVLVKTGMNMYIFLGEGE